jgi:hypothetical protein
MNFLYFWCNKIHVSLTLVISFLFPLWCRLSFGRRHHNVHRVTLSSHGAKMSSLPPLHLSVTIWPVASPLEPKWKHWFHTAAASHPPQTFSPPLNRVSILSHPYPEHHVIGVPPTVIILFHCHPTSIIPPYNDIHGDELANPLSLPEQHICMWIYVKKYFKIPQHHVRLSTSPNYICVTYEFLLTCIGMTIRVSDLGHPWVLDPTVAK